MSAQRPPLPEPNPWLACNLRDAEDDDEVQVVEFVPAPEDTSGW